MMADQKEAALKDLEKAVQLKPDFAEAHFWNGISNMVSGTMKGVADLNKALQAVRLITP